MIAFAALLDRLAFTPQRNEKIRLMTDYFARTPDPERGFALAALTGELAFTHAKPGVVRALGQARIDGELFALSYDYVGDLAETVALIWPAQPGANRVPSFDEVVETLQTTSKAALPARLEARLDALDATGRWALLKLITGGLRVGVSARLARLALAEWKGVAPDTLEEIWPGLTPPYRDLFAWLEGTGAKPQAGAGAAFRPVMLAYPLEDRDLRTLDPRDFLAEWKWDGIRVQAVREGTRTRLWSRAGEDISAAFPDLAEVLPFDGAVDGELLVVRDDAVAPFQDLQQRLNRKQVSAKRQRDYPVRIRAYDLLAHEGADLRSLPLSARRARLEALIAAPSDRLDLSPRVAFSTWDELAAARAAEPAPGVEGVMVKRADAPYRPGRVKGLWFKWKRDPHLIDAVLMYAQRGHGRRSSYYSDYTFGVWRDDTLVPVGKAYFGFTDAELAELDRFVRANTVARFGPVREVVHTPEEGFVLEVAFEGLQRSPRHKSGLAMRFPRIHRLRRDKRPRDADRIETLHALLPDAL